MNIHTQYTQYPRVLQLWQWQISKQSKSTNTQHCLRAYGWFYIYMKCCVCLVRAFTIKWHGRNLMCSLCVQCYTYFTAAVAVAAFVVVAVVILLLGLFTGCLVLQPWYRQLHRCDAIYAVFYSMGFYKRSFHSFRMFVVLLLLALGFYSRALFSQRAREKRKGNKYNTKQIE